ncbi:MAG: hypothetical protein AVDCRST_MAG78-2282 [uncultured Rubrobacteraceae bacterium]|uniref:Uncharacterized protein n=1 Tax=uncultured Rubrobacteraceae bacterium TaxID=349277 RepID=A0A6J4QJB1_9ACTN|nr:MAG: hypothetical protein AVDCRST_MAG78-2282 [uncultured Rubrobacteraceae bacterium]
MRKMTMLAAMLALAVMMMAASPAMAQDRFDRLENRLENRLDRFDDGFFFVDGYFDGFDRFDRFDSDDGISQDSDQEADSGDVDQSFEVSGDGDNSNQSVGIQGVTNTGNAQSQFGFTQFDSEIDDFEFEDGGADIDVSPEFDLESDQSVDQAAAAG